MISIHELRIGNWIKVKRSNDAAFYQVVAIDGLNLKAMPDGARQGEWHCEDGLKPIPITGDFLKRYGYRYDHITWCKKGFYLSEAFLSGTPINKRFWNIWTHGLSGGVTASIKYVHQLQNFYYAYNGEELQIQNPK